MVTRAFQSASVDTRGCCAFHPRRLTRAAGRLVFLHDTTRGLREMDDLGTLQLASADVQSLAYSVPHAIVLH